MCERPATTHLQRDLDVREDVDRHVDLGCKAPANFLQAQEPAHLPAALGRHTVRTAWRNEGELDRIPGTLSEDACGGGSGPSVGHARIGKTAAARDRHYI